MQIEDLLEIPVIGRLMAPEEVRQATYGHTDIPDGIKEYWYLCGDIPLSFWQKYMTGMKNGDIDIGFRLRAFSSPLGAAYATFTVQVEQSQVRFVVPLKGKRVVQFLGEAAYSGVMLMLANDNRQDCFLRSFSVDPTHLLPLLGLCRSSAKLTKHDTLSDLWQTTLAMRGLGVVPSTFSGVEVRDVSVIVILPDGDDMVETVGMEASCTVN